MGDIKYRVLPPKENCRDGILIEGAQVLPRIGETFRVFSRDKDLDGEYIVEDIRHEAIPQREEGDTHITPRKECWEIDMP